MNTKKLINISAIMVFAFVQPAFSERLALTFLPPDLPPADVCNAPPEEREVEELQDGEIVVAPPVQVRLEDKERVRYLSRDIRDLTQDGAREWTAYIEELITRKAVLDPRYVGVNETFERAELLIKAGQLDELEQRGLLKSLVAEIETMTNSQKVKLAHFLRLGIGVEADPTRADALLVDAGFAGNSAALLAIVRLELSGQPVQGWDITPEETATLAFGGMIGQINLGLCDRAERMAREYINGDILEPNQELAYAWRVFAADLGGADAAWRVVEHHLNGTAPRADRDVLEKYLEQAVAGGVEIGDQEIVQLEDSGLILVDDIREMLARHPISVRPGVRRVASDYMTLDVNPIYAAPQRESDLRSYLNDMVNIPNAPAHMFTRLAKEVLLRDGRWGGEVEARVLLTTAIERGDPEAHVLLADMQTRYRRAPEALGAAENLLLDAVSRFEHAPAMAALDELYRCRLPGAPFLNEAAFWSNAYRASAVARISASPSDTAKLSTTFEPRKVALIQGHAVQGHPASKAKILQILQSDPLVSEAAIKFWAEQVSANDIALEDYVIQEFVLASTERDRLRAIDLYRRAYLDVGQAMSLDLAVALVEHAGRDPQTAKDILGLLERSSSRGEGAAIRLLARLTGRTTREVYAEYADKIEERGDFLALMVAAPFVDDAKFADYMDRAVSLMNCSTKDVAELAEAYASRGNADEAMHWLQVGLSLEGGNVLSKLGLTDRQAEVFDAGLPTAVSLGEDAGERKRRAYIDASDARGLDFDPDLAAERLAGMLLSEDSGEQIWAITQFSSAPAIIQEIVKETVDTSEVIRLAAATGDARAQYEWGMYLRNGAESADDLALSAEAFLAAAQAGRADAMTEYGFALGFGVGVETDLKLALIWLQKAQVLGNDRARDLARMIRAMDPE